ncbi:DUF4156 domain-containing protein [Pseudomonas sp. CGJS7]|uniref:DUF4156 domain-containing protein n=1 Tax=Pseudomonas sp. CGJS7 TaxID=3109348 RepID=UPI003008A6DB
MRALALPSSTLSVLTVAVLALSASACTWVNMAPGAQSVRVLSPGAAPGCEKRGEVAVAVKHNVAFYERNQLRVREELETLARNEAPGLQADTIQPLGEPSQGQQRFAAYRCGAGAVPAAQKPASTGAQTYPVEN